MVRWEELLQWELRKDENIFIFNDTLNTFYLQLYGVQLLSLHELLFQISSKEFYYMCHPTDRITHTMAFTTPVVEHWLEWEITLWVHPMMTHRTMSERSYHGARSRSPSLSVFVCVKKRKKEVLYLSDSRHLKLDIVTLNKNLEN